MTLEQSNGSFNFHFWEDSNKPKLSCLERAHLLVADDGETYSYTNEAMVVEGGSYSLITVVDSRGRQQCVQIWLWRRGTVETARLSVNGPSGLVECLMVQVTGPCWFLHSSRFRRAS
jgi:hypothetical protein